MLKNLMMGLSALVLLSGCDDSAEKKAEATAVTPETQIEKTATQEGSGMMDKHMEDHENGEMHDHMETSKEMMPAEDMDHSGGMMRPSEDMGYSEEMTMPAEEMGHSEMMHEGDSSIAQQCAENNRGKWLAEHNECETFDKEWCEANDGTFKECESKCRHQTEVVACVMMCVGVCAF